LERRFSDLDYLFDGNETIYREATMNTEMTDSVVNMLEQGMTIMRAENETQQSMAIQKPRELTKLVHAAIEELRTFPDFAKKSYYSIPYKDYSVNPPREVMVEGLSIKAANALVRHWGNNASGFRVVGADDDRIMVMGVFLDYETNMRRTAEISVSRKAKKRDGTTYALDVTRLNMAIQAGGSKAVRNAILNALPIGLTDGYFAEAKRIVVKGGKVDTEPITPEDIKTAMEGIFKAFEGQQVARAEVINYISRHSEIDSEEGVVAHLQGLLNAIAEGGITIEEAFSIGQQVPIGKPEATTGSIRYTGGQKPAQNAPIPPKPIVPAGTKEMSSKRESKCDICNKDILIADKIVYDPTKGRASHRSHYA
jgi:hypothetical protein